MLIAQISDTHVAGLNKKAYGIAPTANYLTQVVNHINRLKLKADVVLATGDITNQDREEEYQLAKEILDKLNCPYFVIPGNHDSRDGLYSVFGGTKCYKENGFIQYCVNDYELKLIAIDSTIPNIAGGEICDRRAHWLDQKLAESKDQATLLFLHHPPLKLSVPETDVDGFIGADKLGRIVAKYHNIERILCGHVHLTAFSCWNGTIVSTAPPVSMPLQLDLTMSQESSFALGDPAYQLHHWTEDKNLVSHTISVNQQTEIYPFEDSPNS